MECQLREESLVQVQMLQSFSEKLWALLAFPPQGRAWETRQTNLKQFFGSHPPVQFDNIKVSLSIMVIYPPSVQAHSSPVLWCAGPKTKQYDTHPTPQSLLAASTYRQRRSPFPPRPAYQPLPKASGMYFENIQ